MSNYKIRVKFFIMGLPALAGFFLLYLYPFSRTLWYSMIDNTYRGAFVFLDNYISVLKNSYFRLAVKNTIVFSLAGVSCIVMLSLTLSFGFASLGKQFTPVRNLLVSPMVLPTASVIFVWQLIFQSGSYRGLAGRAAGAGFWAILPIYLLYIWKNTGLNIIIFSAAIAGIPPEINEAAALDGAAGLRLRRLVTLPLITPGVMFVLTLSFVNALKVFRESFLFFRTDYPPDIAYTVQYYMNNHFKKLNYPTLTAASVIFTLLIAAVLSVMYRWENTHNDKIY